MRRRSGYVLVLAVVAVSGLPVARADADPPVAGAACAAELDGVMTQLPGGADYLVCREPSWEPAATPFPPSDAWLSYGPAIVLHGQGFRNPNLTSGRWTATPWEEGARCGATQVTVVEPGVLAPPVVVEGEPGQPLDLEVLPKLFTIELTGSCLWTEAGLW